MDVWIFHGAGGHYSSGVFSSRSLAEQWIKMRKLTGILTKYPLDSGVYDWAINNQYFIAKNDNQRSSSFIQKFSSGSQEHYHYLDGQLD